MLSAILLALREGVEASLVVGIVLLYLKRTGRRALARSVWAGVFFAVAASFGVAVLLDRWKISEDGFEGLLMIFAGVLVVTMIWWMNRIARRLKKEIEERVEIYAQQTARWAGLGLAAFVFLMVLREGAELVLILRAVEFSTAGVQVWVGTGIGIALAVAVGAFFFQGTLRIPLQRFFTVTSTILMVVAFQLVLTGLHELSEAMWLPSSKREMATIGPIVRNDFFFFVVILGVAALAVLREWLAAQNPAAGASAKEGANPAELRRRQWEYRKQRGWSLAAAALFLAVVFGMTAEYLYARTSATPPEAVHLVSERGLLRIPLADMDDSNAHFFSADVEGTALRFIVVHRTNGEYATVLDACQICGWKGYHRQGDNLICRNCGAAIYFPSLGQQGGCNPVPVKSHVATDAVIIELSALSESAAKVHP